MRLNGEEQQTLSGLSDWLFALNSEGRKATQYGHFNKPYLPEHTIFLRIFRWSCICERALSRKAESSD